jgi:hypothetical protein
VSYLSVADVSFQCKKVILYWVMPGFPLLMKEGTKGVVGMHLIGDFQPPLKSPPS